MGCCDEGKMSRRMLVIVCGTALLIAAAVVVALRERWQPVPPPDVPVAQAPAEVRVKAVERKVQPVEQDAVDAASRAVAIVCGMCWLGSLPNFSVLDRALRALF